MWVMPPHAVMPGIPSIPSAADGGATDGSIFPQPVGRGRPHVYTNRSNDTLNSAFVSPRIAGGDNSPNGAAIDRLADPDMAAT